MHRGDYYPISVIIAIMAILVLVLVSYLAVMAMLVLELVSYLAIMAQIHRPGAI